jgi:ATP-dependent Clp protease ATP-binding subunit ClpA
MTAQDDASVAASRVALKTCNQFRASPIFRPTLIGRFDERIVFKPLSPEIEREIGRIANSQELNRFKVHGST